MLSDQRVELRDVATVPVSLLTCISDKRTAFGRKISARLSAATVPSPPGAVDVEALGFEPSRRVQNRLALQSRCDNVSSTVAASKRGSLHGEIDRFGRAGGPNEFPRSCSKAALRLHRRHHSR